MALYLVTGGAGFIGSNIVKRLLGLGERVRVVDNFATGRKENISKYLKDIELVNCDIRHINALTRAMRGVDYVLHNAAIPSVPRSVKNPVRTNNVNVAGTLNVLVSARDCGVKRVVYASSSSIYGDVVKLPKREDMKPCPISPYAISKYAGEEYCKVFCRLYGLETVSLRYFNVFGPNQNPKSQYAAVIPKFITSIMKNEPPVIYGDGAQSRDFTFVENVVNANILASKAKKVAGEVFNIACGEKTSLNELVRLVNKITCMNVKPTYMEGRKGDVKHSLADITKAKKMLKYSPKIDILEGLKRTAEYFQ